MTENKLNYNKIFEFAIKNNDIKIVLNLLKNKKVNPSYGDNYAIRYASKNGHIEVVKELLKDERVNPLDIKDKKTIEIINIINDNKKKELLKKIYLLLNEYFK